MPADFRTPYTTGLLAALCASSPELIAWMAVQADGVAGYTSDHPHLRTWHGRRLLHLHCPCLRENRRNPGPGRALLDAAAAMPPDTAVAISNG